MGEIISRFTFKSLTSSVTLPVHEPISFGFEEIVKAKAESDAAVSAELERRLIELALDIGEGYGCLPYRTSERAPDETFTEAKHSEYIYDYNIAAELFEIRRRKNRR